MWESNHETAFGDIKQQLAASVKLGYSNQNLIICVFTDASVSHWATVLNQVPKSDRNKDLKTQGHEPIRFLSGAFSRPASSWSVRGKEEYATLEAMCHVDYLFAGHEVNIYTEHAKLVYPYDPKGKNCGIVHHTASKLTSWAINVNEFRYVVAHLPGERNISADTHTL